MESNTNLHTTRNNKFRRFLKSSSEDVERKIWYKNQCMAPKSTRLIVARKFSTYQSAMYTQGSPMYLQKAALDRSTQPSSVPSLWGAIVGLRGCVLSCSGAKRATMASLSLIHI